MLMARMYNESISANNKLCALVAGWWLLHARGLDGFCIDAVGRQAYHVLGNTSWRCEAALYSIYEGSSELCYTGREPSLSKLAKQYLSIHASI